MQCVVAARTRHPPALVLHLRLDMRRRLVASITGALVAFVLEASVARGMGEADRLSFAVLTIGDAMGSEETTALERVAWELEKRTSVTAAPHPTAVAPSDPGLRRYPLLFVHGAAALPPVEERALDAVRAHLEAGGLLFIDEAGTLSPDAEDPFDRDVRTLVRRLFPRGQLGRVPADHVLYKAFYLLGEPVGRLVRSTSLEALMLDGRIAILYSRNDVLGALARDRLGAAAHAMSSGGEGQREQALRLALNVVMYALCLDYKADQVHVPFLLKRRRPLSEPF